MNRKNTIIAFFLISLMLFLGSRALISNLSPFFDTVNSDIDKGYTVVMNGDIDASRLEKLLIDGGYLSDSRDAAFISQWYKDKIQEGPALENLGAINLDRFKIPADTIRKAGGKELKARLADELLRIGQDDEWKTKGRKTTATVFGEKAENTATIRVSVEGASKGSHSYVQGEEGPRKGVVVRLTEYVSSDSIAGAYDTRTAGYAVTDEKGVATFHVPKTGYYSVLPIREGYQYGMEKGTVDGPLGKNRKFRFTQEPHAVRPFTSATYSKLKNDKALISRTPSQFVRGVNADIVVFILSWLAVFAVTALIDRRRNSHTDSVILLSLMTICGMGLLTLYGQMMPLTDIFYAHKMMDVGSLSLHNFSGGIVIGCALLILFSCVDYLKFYQKYTARFIHNKTLGGGFWQSVSPGLPFVVIALLLMVALRLMGSGPEGSDARVNLFGFQPSEIIKYFIVFFLAFFFMEKGDVIKTFGQRMTYLARRRHWIIISAVVAVIAVVCVMFLAVLKDMGPGVVILATFILMYSVVRRDVPQLMLGIISYMLVVGIGFIVSDSEIIRLFAVGIWFAGWIWYGLSRRKVVYESAIFFNALVSMFLVGGTLLRPFLPHMADRLTGRANMAWSGIFDNAVAQGDQIAQGLWGTASGGFSGMGLGGGSPYFIPAGHTDMILNSLGEQMGWLGILIIALCFFLLISRTMVAAQYSGHKFTFYLCLGLGLLMGVQFLFIALGSIGAIPLSGVPVPLMSYSGTSMVMALAAYGIVISISRHRGTEASLRQFVVAHRGLDVETDNREARLLTKNLFAGMTLFFVGVLCVVAFNGYYQLFVSGKTQLRPAITADAHGMRVLDYNPRINQLIEMLDRGNIYDRNGLLLATSVREALPSAQAVQESLGFTVPGLDRKQFIRQKRYYTLGNHTVFMVGDVNRSDVFVNFSGSTPMGYLAESENLEYLKGFKSTDSIPRYVDVAVPFRKYVRFLEPVADTVKYLLRDYSVLLPGLAQPKYRNKWVEEWNAAREQRDLHLAMDARLQTLLQLKMENYIKNNLSGYKDVRASVVVMNAGSGDVLSSANYPLPAADSIVRLRSLTYKGKTLDRFGDVPSEWRPGKPVTERDLGLTFQTAPGSTAKVLTAMAGLQKLNSEMMSTGYQIKPFMSVEPAGSEPNVTTGGKNRNGGSTTYLEDAIKYSSNCYFIMLLNDKDLYSPLATIYENLGLTIGRSVIGNKEFRVNSFMLNPSERTEVSDHRFDFRMAEFREHGLADYKRYMKTKGQLPANTPWARNQNRMSSIQNYTGIAWGQGRLTASPFNMAMAAGVVGNNGRLMAPRFFKEQNVAPAVELLTASNASILGAAMEGEASKHGFEINGVIGGKTGTPNRKLRNQGVMNDAWYMCYIKNNSTGNVLSVALRIERVPEGINSTRAVDFFQKAVLSSLRECGYLK